MNTSPNRSKAVPALVSHVRDDVTDLLHRHLDGTLTADESARLAQILTTDPAAAAAFADLTRLDAGLSIAFKEESRTVLFTRRMTRAAASLRPVRRVSLTWRPLAAAAGLAIALGGVWYFLPGDGTTPSLTETRKRPAPKVAESENETSSSALIAAAPAPVDAAAMKRRFRGFHVPSLAVEAMPVSQALAALHQQWETLPHADPASAKTVTFTISAAATKRWKAPEDEPRVTLKVPGVSLYTQMELLAAQAGLKLAVTAAGALFDADPRSGGNEVKTWMLPVFTASAATVPARSESRLANYESAFRYYSELATSDDRLTRLSRSADRPNWDVAVTTSGNNDFASHLPPVNEYERMASSLKTKLNALKGLEGDALVYHAMLLNVEDATIHTFYPEYEKTKLELTQLAGSGFGPGHPKVIGLRRQLEQTSTVLLSAAQNYREKLPVSIAQAEAALETAKNIEKSRDVPRYVGNVHGSSVAGLIAVGESLPSSVRANCVPAMAELLAGHDVTNVTLAFDPDAGVVNATGPVSQLRVAQALMHAMNESQSAGVALESQVLEWQDAMPPSLAADSGKPIPVSEAQRAALVKAHPVWEANTRHTYRTRLQVQPSKSGSVAGDMLAQIYGEVPPHWSRVQTWNDATGQTADFDPPPITFDNIRNEVDTAVLNAWFKQVQPKPEVTAKRRGDLYEMDCTRLPALVEASEMSGDGSEPAMCRRLFASSLKLREGQWVQVNFPKQGSASRAFTVFLRVRAAVMDAE